MANGTKPEMSVADWLTYADSFLSREDVADLRRKIANGIRERREQTKRDLARLDRDLAVLEHTPPDLTEEPPQGPEPIASEALPSMSVGKLVQHFGAMSPGGRASDFIDFVRKHRPDVEPKAVHAELYRLSKPEGPRFFSKKGEKPNTRYFPRRPAPQ